MIRQHVFPSCAAALAACVSLAAQQPSSGPKRGVHVPLRENLMIVTAIQDDRGDYESIKRVTSTDPALIHIAYSVDRPPADDSNPLAALLGGDCETAAQKKDSKALVHQTGSRAVDRADIETARVYRYMFDVCAQGEQHYEGTTALGVSSAVLRELRTNGSTRLSVPQPIPGGAVGNLIGGLLGGMKKSADDDPLLRTGTLTRIERTAVPFKAIVNDEPTELPAIHGRGKLGDDQAEFWLLDDEENPLSLRWQIGSTDTLQVIRISFPPDPPAAPAAPTPKPAPPPVAAPPPPPAKATPAPAPVAATPIPAAAAAPALSHIESDLAKTGRTVTYGIYFDFASDHIKPESQPVLAEIAKAMTDNPSWSLSVEGHTDNIGGDAYNLDLSKRRAAAVKQALVTQYGIEGKRLQPSGYGASRPKDTNATLEGRARNRRVELAKLN